jgi:hypothetical protein
MYRIFLDDAALLRLGQIDAKTDGGLVTRGGQNELPHRTSLHHGIASRQFRKSFIIPADRRDPHRSGAVQPLDGISDG